MPGQFGLKYAYSAKNIVDVLAKLRETGRPDKLSITYIKKVWLLNDTKNSAVVDILRDMQFLDENGVPTDLYAEYQNSSLSKTALAKGIKNAYPELFKAYPNAYNLPKETLEGYFKQKTGAEKSVLDKIVATFTTLCSLAGFSSDVDKPKGFDEKPPEQASGQNPGSGSTLLPITMNIQIVIPSDATEEQYDKIFSSIKKFLTK
jgi:hypothetical protein